MDKFRIRGGNRVHGEISVSGAKNAAVAILPAAILASKGCRISNLPAIDDINNLKFMLTKLGATVKMEDKHTITIDPSTMNTNSIDEELAKKLRASYYFLGAFIGKYKEAEVFYPGGCDIGSRPIDQHIKGLEALGVEVIIEHGIIKAKAKKLVGANIYLDIASVGATINIMLAASRAEGITIIENAAREPHIVDTANFLNAMGANIRGAGTETIKIKGVDEMLGCQHIIIPDQIETGTYMAMAAASRGDVYIKDVVPTHMETVTAKMREMGINIEEYDDIIRVNADKRAKAVTIKTQPYPGFPTDLQQPISVVMTLAEGVSIINESVYEGRYKHMDELIRMGANVKVEGRIAVIEGVEKLSGAPVVASDLRAGAAMVTAGISADGETVVSNIGYIDRGYEELEKKLVKINVDIERISEINE